ncbi:MAG: hypothetical protein AB8I08_09400 [Sandaracinaceae bacterium]
MRNLYGASAGTALFGVATCCLSGMGQFYFIISPLVMLVAGVTLFHAYNAAKIPEARRQLGNGYYLVLGLCVVGGLFGALGTGIGVLAMIGAGLAR